MTNPIAIKIKQAELDVRNITSEINRIKLDYWLTEEASPWEINNGLCDEFAEDVRGCLDIPNDSLYVITFFNLTNTGDDDWTDFYHESMACFDLAPTHGLTKAQFIEALKQYADETHAWLVYERHGVVRHFDAECPQGVANPFELPTYEKSILAYKQKLKGKELDAFYKMRKHACESAFFDEYHIRKAAK